MTDPQVIVAAAAVGGVIAKDVSTMVRELGLKIFGPVCDDLGNDLLTWFNKRRSQNLALALQMAEERLHGSKSGLDLKHNPATVSRWLEAVAEVDESSLRDKWVNLLFAMMSRNGNDNEDRIFMSILSEVTHIQILLLDAVGGRTVLVKAVDGLRGSLVRLGKDFAIKHGIEDAAKLTCAVEHFVRVGVFSEGSAWGASGLLRRTPPQPSFHASLTVTGLFLYARCQGHNGSIDHFFTIEVENFVDTSMTY